MATKMQSKNKKLFIKNGPPERERLEGLVKQFGTVERIDIFRDRHYAFVTYTSSSSVDLAIAALDGKIRYNRRLILSHKR